MSLPHLALRAEVTRELILQGVTGDPLRAALVIVEHSYGVGLDAAPFDAQQTLAAILGWNEDQCSRAVRELRDRKIVHVFPYAGAWWYELRPCGRWLPPAAKLRKTRVPAERIAAARAAWDLAQQSSRRDPDQQDLIKWSPGEMRDGGYGALLLAESRAEALGRVGDLTVRQVSEENARKVDGPSSRRVDGASSRGASTPPVRTRASEHVHVPTSVPQSMVHDHEERVDGPSSRPTASHDHAHARLVADGGDQALRALSNEALEERLDSEGRYWLEQLPELFGATAGKFRRTWLLRFCDRWSSKAYAAIGETKRMMVQGERFRKGPGECANDLFHRFKHEEKKL